MEFHILNALNEYGKKKPIRFHMPGHKADKKFNKIFRQASLDITELAFSDNLNNPTGIILKAEEDVATILRAEKSFFLTDGSTSGIFSMLKAVKHLGNKIIISRNSHKSVFNACELLQIEPLLLNQNIKQDIVLPPSLEEIENLVKKNSGVIGVLLISPDYYGNIINYEGIKALMQKLKKVFLVDGAHGAHLRFFGKYAGDYADMWVDGVHKTLPCLTQSAVVSVNKKALINSLSNAVKFFRTTSPSYNIMASIEFGIKYIEENKENYDELIESIKLLKKRLKMVKYSFYDNEDIFKLVVDFKSIGVSPMVAEEYLLKNNIYVELNDGRYIIFYLSPLNKKSQILKLYRCLKKIAKVKKIKNTYEDKISIKTGKRNFSYLVACDMEKELISLDKSIGRICGENAGIFPPCFPIITCGEEITADVVDVLKKSKSTFGLENKKIKVIIDGKR